MTRKRQAKPSGIRHIFVIGLCIIFSLLCLFAARQVSAVAPIPATDTHQMKRAEGILVGKSVKAVFFTWDTPALREDGAPLPEAEIATYVIEYSIGGKSKKVSTGKVNSYLLRVPYSGTYSFRIATVDTDGQQGNYSDAINLTL